jgi:hypothetical protein
VNATKHILSPKKTSEISTPASTPTEDKKRDAASRSDEITMILSEDFPGWFVQYIPGKSNGGDYYYYRHAKSSNSDQDQK